MLYWPLLILIILGKELCWVDFIIWELDEGKEIIWVQTSGSDIARFWRVWKCLWYIGPQLKILWLQAREVASSRIMTMRASCRTWLKSAGRSTQKEILSDWKSRAGSFSLGPDSYFSKSPFIFTIDLSHTSVCLWTLPSELCCKW